MEHKSIPYLNNMRELLKLGANINIISRLSHLKILIEDDIKAIEPVPCLKCKHWGEYPNDTYWGCKLGQLIPGKNPVVWYCGDNQKWEG